MTTELSTEIGVTAPTAVKKQFKLGRYAFSVENCNAEYQEVLANVLPPYVDGQDSVEEVKTGCNLDVRALCAHVAARHTGSAAVESCYLVSSAGRKVLIAGTKKSGKTTTAMALALGHGWKVFADGCLLVDHQNSRLIPFAAPFVYDEWSLNVIEQQAGRVPNYVFRSPWGLARELWSPIGEWMIASESEIVFDLAIFLNREDGLEVGVSELTPSEYLRKLLPVSNLLRVRRSSELMAEALQNTRCASMTKLELDQRLERIMQLESAGTS